MQQQQQDSGKVSPAYLFGLVYLACNAHRMCLAVFMRHSFGTRAFEPHGLFALIGMLLAAGAYPSFKLLFFPWIITLAGQRVHSYRLRWKGLDGHSRYQGYPWLAMRWPGVKTEEDGRRAEPFICLFGGLVLVTISEPLGLFVIAGFVTFAACLAIDALVDRHRLQAMRDGEFEMRYYAEKYRDGR